ncbi:MAG: FecCD family ABC transporter permease [Alphaproteobacteria bacterium]
MRLNAVLTLIVLALAGLSLFGGWGGSWSGNAAALAEAPPDVARLIFWEVRLPRVALGLIVGAVLGLGGAALQGLLRNPLAEPGLVGASSGAALGAVIVFYFGAASAAPLALPLGGISGGLSALVLLFLLAGRTPGITSLILAGVAVNAFAGALTALALNLAPNPFAVTEIVFWTMGSLADRGLDHVALALVPCLAGAALMLGAARGLDALTLGEDAAHSLGFPIGRLRAQVLAGAGLAVGAAVSVSGVIGFVGLVVPHLVRPFVRHEPGRLLVPSALAGAGLLTAADIGVRLVPGATELKIGVLTALLGAPFFLHLLLKARRQEL